MFQTYEAKLAEVEKMKKMAKQMVQVKEKKAIMDLNSLILKRN